MIHRHTQTHTDTHTLEYYSDIKKKENLLFAVTGMDLEGIMLSEISQTEKDKYCMRSLICGMEKIKQTSECNRFAAKENKLVVTK